MKLNFKIQRWKIKYKLTIAMYTVLFPILLGVTFYLVSTSANTLREELSKAYQNLVESVDNSILVIEEDIEDLLTYITINKEFRYVLNMSQESEFYQKPLIWKTDTAAEFIAEMISVKNNIVSLSLFAENGTYPFIIRNTEDVLNRDITVIKQLSALQESIDALGDTKIMALDAENKKFFVNNKEDKILFCKAILSYDKKKILGYLTIAINSRVFEDLFNEDRLKENESILMLGNQGELLVETGNISDKDLSFMRALIVDNKIESSYYITDESYIFFNTNNKYGHTLFYVIPKLNWDKQVDDARLMPITIAIILFVMILPISMFLTRFITVPLSKLHSSMLKLQEGDFKQEVEVLSDDELGEVTRVYNQMVKRINQLIEENYIIKLREKESELDILQAQINPHFLYNTLDSLYWDALHMGNTEHAENIMALSELFRLALSRGKGIVSVEIEFNLIESYLRIQKMRFEKRMDYKVTLSSQIKEKEIPKLILQPFVENAIVHGLENSDKSGMIVVHGFQEEDFVVFKIADNGIGMEKKQLEELYVEDKREYKNQRISKYAIRNVKERLKLRYGNDFSLNIHSDKGVGTTITMKLPLKE